MSPGAAQFAPNGDAQEQLKGKSDLDNATDLDKDNAGYFDKLSQNTGPQQAPKRSSEPAPGSHAAFAEAVSTCKPSPRSYLKSTSRGSVATMVQFSPHAHAARTQSHEAPPVIDLTAGTPSRPLPCSSARGRSGEELEQEADQQPEADPKARKAMNSRYAGLLGSQRGEQGLLNAPVVAVR